MCLEVLDTGEVNWQSLVREKIATGRNCFVILPPGPGAARELCESAGLPLGRPLKTISRADFLRVSHHVAGEGYDQVMNAFHQHQRLVFLDQLEFPFNHPPNLKPFIVYSPVLGILSDHSTLTEAASALSAYHRADHPVHSNADAVLYRWSANKWVLEE